MTCGSLNTVVVRPGAWIIPVVEAYGIAFGASSCRDHDGSDYEPKET